MVIDNEGDRDAEHGEDMCVVDGSWDGYRCERQEGSWDTYHLRGQHTMLVSHQLGSRGTRPWNMTLRQ